MNVIGAIKKKDAEQKWPLLLNHICRDMKARRVGDFYFLICCAVTVAKMPNSDSLLSSCTGQAVKKRLIGENNGAKWDEKSARLGQISTGWLQKHLRPAHLLITLRTGNCRRGSIQLAAAQACQFHGNKLNEVMSQRVNNIPNANK